MLETMMVGSESVMYVMAAVGILGVLAKIVNRLTLYRLIKAAGNMPKSTHKLMKLVKAKYEHACMAHELVENIDVFVEKYIYEYRGFLFRIHTWRQIEVLSVWFVGILAAVGAVISYMESGLTETVYQYIAGGAAEAVLLMVIMRMSDEPYKIKAIKMYMVDYLENVCALRTRKQSRKEREFIDVIPADSAVGSGKAKEQKTAAELHSHSKEGGRGNTAGAACNTTDAAVPVSSITSQTGAKSKKEAEMSAGTVPDQSNAQWQAQAVKEILDETGSSMIEKRLPINIEGEPQERKKKEQIRQNVSIGAAENESGGEKPQIREETIRQILEEFLA